MGISMFGALKIRKSAGVRVTPRAHAMISQGNVARDRSHWEEAARHYEQALALDPRLTHIWVQAGHMYKEDRAWERAVYAYAQAAKLAPTDPAVIGWLFEIAGRLGDDERRGVTEVLEAHFPNAVFERGESPAPVQGVREVVFDVSDLVAYFARARVPTGIQRVQIEVIRGLAADVSPRICCAIEGRDAWVEIPASVFNRITDIATDGGQYSAQDWVAALAALQLSLLLGDPIVFSDNAVLLNLGTSWWLQNYFLQVRNAQQQSNVEYVPFVHDLIPIITPHHCVDGLVEDFVFWATSVFNHASRFLVNSEATKRDLLAVAGDIGRVISPDAVTVVRLDARFAMPKPLSDPVTVLNGLGVGSQPFVLFVSTIESRKDHVGTLRVWQTLIARYGRAVPKLVCVGNNGWLNEAFYELLASDETLGERVLLLSKISDRELGLLYEKCLFTVYPSTYEGWGLPITEALSYGKPVIAANNSSIPEAGGALALYFETGNVAQFAALVEKLSFDEPFRETVSQRIVYQYRPRNWAQVARQIHEAVTAPQSVKAVDRGIVPGLWYDLSRSRHRSVWAGSGSAEVLRVGRGWADVDRKGAWIRSSRASLRLDLPDDGPYSIAIRLLAEAPTEYWVEVDGERIDFGTTATGTPSWALHRHSTGRRSVCIDICCGAPGDPGRTEFLRSLCVTGLAAYRGGDPSHEAFLEAVALGRLDQIKAFSRAQ